MCRSSAYDDFTRTLWAYYVKHGRQGLPWRQPEPDGSFDPYKILVSEIMLQQTQVPRVIPKYIAFIERFPNVRKLATAELGSVLRSWQGLGYNRRAKFLWQVAKQLRTIKTFPQTQAELTKLPGVGSNTAGAVLAYAYNQPVIFIETNIRTVYIHHFFQDRADVTDKEISDVVAQTFDYKRPREFYWALMDYGSYLKARHGNLNRASKHYVVQSAFEGSPRQLRGKVLCILQSGPQTRSELQLRLADARADAILDTLDAEQLISRSGGVYRLGS